MKKHLSKILPGLALAAIAIFTYTLYSGEEEVRWFGYAEGEYVRVALPEGGTLTSLSAARGDQVSTGEPLFALESIAEEAAVAEAEAALEQARFSRDNLLKGLRDSEIDALLSQKEQAGAELELAAITLERQKNLLLSDNTSEQAVDQAEAVFERAKARVDELEAMLVTAKLPARVDEVAAANARIKQAEASLDKARFLLSKRQASAPADALVFDTFFRAGEFIPQGQAVVSLLPPENVKIRFFIPEASLALVSYGDPVLMLCDGCGGGVAGTITYISPEAEYTPPVIYSEAARQKLVFMIEAWPDDPAGFPLKPGQPVEVILP